MNNNNKILLKIFDLDDELVEDVKSFNDSKINELNITLKKYYMCYEEYGSIRLLSKGLYISKWIRCPINEKPTIINCRLRKYVCVDCGSYFVEKNPISYKNTNMTRPALIAILKELKPYNATQSQVGRRFSISTTQVINLFDRYIRIKRKHLPRILLIDEIFFSRKARYKYPSILMNFDNKVIIDLIESRKQEIIVDYFFKIPKKEKEAVEFICTDMSYTFKLLCFL